MIEHKIPEDLFYTQTHEWLKVNGNEAFVGITDYAQRELGDIVFIEVNSVNKKLKKGEAFGTIEAVKTVSDIYIPVSGTVLEFNPKLELNSDLINKEPYEEGWIIKISIDNPDELSTLMDANSYKKLLEAL